MRALSMAVVALLLAACAPPSLIHHRSTPYGDILVYEEPDGLRTLRFTAGGSRQSVVKLGDPDHLEVPYVRLALAGLAFGADPRRILVAGLGGGSLPSFLRNHYLDATIDVVEISVDVVDVAKKYFGVHESDRLRIHVQDARDYVESVPASTYDAIFLDAYGEGVIPKPLTTQEFLLAVRRAVQPGGIVAANLWNRGNNPLYDDMLATYRATFDSIATLRVTTDLNIIVLALPRDEPLEKASLAQRAKALSERKKFRFDLGELVDMGFLEEARGGKVLRD